MWLTSVTKKIKVYADLYFLNPDQKNWLDIHKINLDEKNLNRSNIDIHQGSQSDEKFISGS